MLSRKLLLSIIIILCAFAGSAQTKTFTGKPQYRITTKRAGVVIGNTNIELFPAIAPKHVSNFDSLVGKQFFDSTAFHRVIPGFMIQGGDPNSRHGTKSTWGLGDPKQPKVNAEFSAAEHLRGTLSAARSADTNSATSQFFICIAPAAWLNGKYSVYGHVTSGMNFVDTIVKSPRDAKDNPLQKIEMFITYLGSNDTVPATPVLTSPVNNSQDLPTSQLLKWTAVNDAIVYHLQVSTDSTFSGFVLLKNVPSASYTVTNLHGLKKYYWRVRANNGGNLSAYSPVWNFTTLTAAAKLLSPANASSNVSKDPLFIWDSVPGATSYRLQVCKNPGFTVSGLVYNQNNLTTTSQQVMSLSPGTYYWRVRGANGATEGTYSAQFSFTVTSGIGMEDLSFEQNGYELRQNIPNPSNGQTVITYVIPTQSEVVLSLCDALGRELMILVNDKKEKGEHQVQVDLNKIPEGIYFYKINAAGYSKTRKMLIE